MVVNHYHFTSTDTRYVMDLNIADCFLFECFGGLVAGVRLR